MNTFEIKDLFLKLECFSQCFSSKKQKMSKKSKKLKKSVDFELMICYITYALDKKAENIG